MMMKPSRTRSNVCPPVPKRRNCPTTISSLIPYIAAKKPSPSAIAKRTSTTPASELLIDLVISYFRTVRLGSVREIIAQARRPSPCGHNQALGHRFGMHRHAALYSGYLRVTIDSLCVTPDPVRALIRQLSFLIDQQIETESVCGMSVCTESSTGAHSPARSNT